MAKRNDELFFDESGDYPTEIEEQFEKHVEAFEQAEWCQQFQILLESGISLPAPGELADTELAAKLGEVVGALALLGSYLEHTDHLSDRELYTLLWEDVLREQTVIHSPTFAMNCHIDLIGSGSAEDNAIFLKYYADEHERALWAEEFPGDFLPGREPLPFDRDRHLPKPDQQPPVGVH